MLPRGVATVPCVTLSSTCPTTAGGPEVTGVTMTTSLRRAESDSKPRSSFLAKFVGGSFDQGVGHSDSGKEGKHHRNLKNTVSNPLLPSNPPFSTPRRTKW